jgi:hypothetical protein
MSNAARIQPEGVHDAHVVGVRDASLRQAKVGLVLSLCLGVALLAASHPGWKMVWMLGLLSVTAVCGSVRAALKFRSRLDKAESLPSEAVEAFGRPKRRRVRRKQSSGGAAALVAAVGGALTAFGPHGWVPDVVFGAMAAFIADGLARPLATAFVVARWEPAHGRTRLFRSLARDEEGKDTLYVTDRPVPAA